MRLCGNRFYNSVMLIQDDTKVNYNLYFFMTKVMRGICEKDFIGTHVCFVEKYSNVGINLAIRNCQEFLAIPANLPSCNFISEYFIRI